MRALIVGFGSIGRRHLENLRACGVSEFVVARPSGRPPGAEEGLRFVEGIAEAIAAQPDFAVVASPSATHAQALLPLLEANLPCYVEKPAVTSEADLASVKRVLGASGTPPPTLSGCNLRFMPSLQRVRDALRAGVIGTPVRASLQAGQWLPDWRPARDYRQTYSASASAGGGVVFDLVHELDVARWLFGEFEEVRALGGKLSSLEIAVEDTACILLGRRAGGPVVALSLDYVSRRPVRHYDIVGDRGTLTWDLGAATCTLATESGTEILDTDPLNFDIARTYVAAMHEFVAAVNEARPAAPDLVDGLASAALALRAKRALAAEAGR